MNKILLAFSIRDQPSSHSPQQPSNNSYLRPAVLPTYMEISRSDLHASNHSNARKRNLFIQRWGFFFFFFLSDWKNFQETKQLTRFSWTLPYIWEAERERTTFLLPARYVAMGRPQGEKKERTIEILLWSSQHGAASNGRRNKISTCHSGSSIKGFCSPRGCCMETVSPDLCPDSDVEFNRKSKHSDTLV